jgi:predicted RNA-binding protein with RPS1 domain
VSDVLKEGKEVMVKVLEIDKQGRVKLSVAKPSASQGRDEPAPADASTVDGLRPQVRIAYSSSLAARVRSPS